MAYSIYLEKNDTLISAWVIAVDNKSWFYGLNGL